MKKWFRLLWVLVAVILIMMIYASKSNSESKKVYNSYNVTNISDLDGKRFVIANLNTNYKAVLSEESDENGIIANKNIDLYEIKDGIAGNKLASWLFTKVSDAETNGDIYEITNSQGKFLNIDGTKVKLIDSPSYVWIRKSPVRNGQIVITDTEGKYFLDWYGANGRDISFQGWNSTNLNNVNESFTL